MAEENVLGIREVEQSLGISVGVLKGWHRDHQDVGRIEPGAPEAELKRLYKENERLQRERTILKKAVLDEPAFRNRAH